jgi:hypothetical protein
VQYLGADVFGCPHQKSGIEAAMESDPLARLEAAIAASAAERDRILQKDRAEQEARMQLQEEAKAIWAERRKELPDVVEAINGLLRRHGYAGVALRMFDLKHSDIDRAVVEFAHSEHSASKILLCATLAGDFTCSVGTVDEPAGATRMPISELTEDRFKEALAEAVMDCLKGKRAPRPD